MIARTDVIARWVVIALVVLCAVHGVATIRGTYADGAFDLYTMLQGRWLLDGNRAFAPIMTQGFAWLGIAVGITSVQAIAVLHSLGVVGLPTILWAVALLLLRHNRLFWPMVAIFSVVFLNSGLVSIGQYNQLYSYVAVCVALLVRPRLGLPGAIVLVVLSVLMFRTYEAVFYLGPVVAALAIVTWRRRVGSPGVPRWDGVVRIVAAVILLIDAVGGAVIVLFPSDPANRAAAANVLEPFTYNPQFTISTILGMAYLGAMLLLTGAARAVALAVLAVGALVLLIPGLWSQPWMHYHVRTTTGLLLAVLVVLALVLDARTKDVVDPPPLGAVASPSASALVWLLPVVLLVGQLASFTANTQGIRNWVATFEQALAERSGVVELYDTPAGTESSRWAWPWTDPFLSVLFRPQGSDTVILSPNVSVGTEELKGIPDPLPPQYHP